MAINTTTIPANLNIGTDFAPRGIPDNEISGFIIQTESFSVQDIAEEVFDQLGAKVGHQVYDRVVNVNLQVIGATPESDAKDLIGKTFTLKDPIDGTDQDFYTVGVTENGSYNGLRTWTVDLTRNYFWPARKGV